MSQKLLPFKDEKGELTGLHIDVASRVLYVNKKIAGVRHKFSTGMKETELSKAKKIANKLLKDRLGNKVKLTSLIGDELDSYLSMKHSEGLKEDTIKNVRNAVKQIRGYWGEMYPSDITVDNLPGWYKWFKEEYQGQQMENAVKYMRNFCRYLSEKVVNGRPLLPAVPTIKDPEYKKIRRARKKKKARIITPEEFKKIYDTAENLSHKVLALFMYTMATRITETLELEFGQEVLLDLEPPIYRWADGQNKADHDGFHALNPVLLEHLRELRELRRDEETRLLFPQSNNNQKPLKEQQIDWQAWRERAKLGWHWTPHTFRHTCLSNLFNDETNPQAVIIKLYRVSLAVALETYVKTTMSSVIKMQSAIKVDL